MANENALKFKEFAEKNPELMTKLKEAKTVDEIIAIAAENGFTIEASDLTPENAEGEINLEELDSVAGGSTDLCDCSDTGSVMCSQALFLAEW